MRAQNAVETLRRAVAVKVSVRRDGQTASLPVDQPMPGDIVELIAGDLVPADCRLLESRDLYVNEALLTGEAYPAEKLAGEPAGETGREPGASGDRLAGALNAVFSGTSVISGTAIALVCLMDAQTSLGKLAASLAEKPPATAFAVGIRKFGMMIMRFTVFMVLFVLVVNISFQRPLLESLLFAVALAVGLTPELLSMIVTVTLARSALQMSKRRMIVKRLSAIHDLGAMDMLCTDKTGTLTEAMISLVRTTDGVGLISAQAFAKARINSHFESGMKSPLDDAIVSARVFDVTSWRKIDEMPFDFERRRVSMAGAALILPFLPMLPIQILLNNLIYNVSEVAIPFDSVDPEAITGPVQWDMKLVERFMLLLGPVSSVFDFLTFYALPQLFGATEALFLTGWFIESMTTQGLVIFSIPTRRRAWRSRPGQLLVNMKLGAVALALALPLLPIGRWFGFVPPPPLFFIYLLAATLAYLALVEVAKAFFYGAWARSPKPV